VPDVIGSTAPPTTRRTACVNCATRCANAPAQGRFKVFIIDEVHMLSSAAFNAPAEDPGGAAGACEVRLCDDRWQKVLPTIISRFSRGSILKPDHRRSDHGAAGENRGGGEDHR